MKYSNVTKQPRKKRKALYNASLHEKQKLTSVHLSKDLRTKEKKRSINARKGDKVKVLRGNHAKKEGKIARIDLKKTQVFIEGVTFRNTKGKEQLIGFQPSNLVIIELTERKVKKNG